MFACDLQFYDRILINGIGNADMNKSRQRITIIMILMIKSKIMISTLLDKRINGDNNIYNDIALIIRRKKMMVAMIFILLLMMMLIMEIIVVGIVMVMMLILTRRY